MATLQQVIFTTEGSPSGTLSSLPPSSTGSSPLSITFSDKPFPDETPATSPAPTQPVPAPPPHTTLPLHTHPNMTDHKGSLQWEGDTDLSLAPGQFQREIDNKIDEWRHMTDRQKVQCLKNNIAFGSDADEWFKKLGPNERDTYEHLTGIQEAMATHDGSKKVQNGMHPSSEGMGPAAE